MPATIIFSTWLLRARWSGRNTRNIMMLSSGWCMETAPTLAIWWWLPRICMTSMRHGFSPSLRRWRKGLTLRSMMSIIGGSLGLSRNFFYMSGWMWKDLRYMNVRWAWPRRSMRRVRWKSACQNSSCKEIWKVQKGISWKFWRNGRMSWWKLQTLPASWSWRCRWSLSVNWSGRHTERVCLTGSDALKSWCAILTGSMRRSMPVRWDVSVNRTAVSCGRIRWVRLP